MKLSWGGLKSWLLGGVKTALLKEIDKLDQYEDDLANIIRKKLNPDETAKMVVDYVQDLARKLVDKYL